MNVALLIPAAGFGHRLGAGEPKAAISVCGRPLIGWCLSELSASESVQTVVVAAPPGLEREFAEMVRQFAGSVPVQVVTGGRMRADSVTNCLKACAAHVDTVAVHDAARPFVRRGQLDEALAELIRSDCDAVVCAAPVADTIKLVGSAGQVVETVDRRTLRAAQTPQVFKRRALESAIAAAGKHGPGSASDEAFLVERWGGSVRAIASTSENMKVTTPFDLWVARRLIGECAG